SYDRVMQILGTPDNMEPYPPYRRAIPASVFDASWNHCTKDQFRRCVRTGDIAAFMAYFMAIDRQAQLLGARFSAEREAEGTSYLERCGRWEAKIDTYYLATGGWT